MKLGILSILLTWVVALGESSEPQVSEAIVKRVEQGIEECFRSFYGRDTPQTEAIRRSALDGVEDRDLIRAIAVWMFRQEAKTHIHIPHNAFALINSPKREIDDLSELRNLLRNENNSKRFFMLSEFASCFQSPMFGYGESFLSERARGLLLSGPAADSGQGATDYDLSDISYYTYGSILGYLRRTHSEFVSDVLPSLQSENRKVKVLALARWLKENQPGCEDLPIQIDSRTRPDKHAPVKRNGVSGTAHAKIPDAASAHGWNWLLASGLATVAIASIILFLNRRKRT